MLTPERCDAIISHIRSGSYPDVAAQAEGVSRGTYYRWMARGRNREEPYAGFCDLVMRARAQAETMAVAIVHELATEDPKLAISWLERAHASRWSPHVRRTVGVAFEGALDAIEKEFKGEPEVVVRVLQALARAEGISPTEGEGEQAQVH